MSSKLTAEELQQIKDLQSKYNQAIFEIGASEAQLIAFHQGIERLQKAKENLISDLASIEQKETELVKSLQEKYGQGNIDLETGEITLDQQ
jgi:hypothetical protein